MSYEGQPEYVRVGFQADLLRHWIVEKMTLPDDEWGREVRAMFEFVDATENEERAAIVLGWVWEGMTLWHDEDWYADWNTVYEIRAAQDEYEDVVAYWSKRAKGFNGSTPETRSIASDALEEVIASLPAWVKPDPNAPPLPDPEREQYERLKAKFEPA